MIYLKSFNLLDVSAENNVLRSEERKIFNNVYPLDIFPHKDFCDIKFDTITCFYGGNGSGKSTVLNIIACKLNAIRKTTINKGSYFDLYLEECNYRMDFQEPLEIKIVTSDDIFDYLLDIRSINSEVNRRKEKLSREYLNFKFNEPCDNFDEYENIKNSCKTHSESLSRYVRSRLNNNNIIEQSNGESALFFWEKEIKEDSIYILDEPENSLSAENQIKLKKFIEDSARFYNCQFIISTHSPFLLALEGAKIYDLDSMPVCEKKWEELENIKLYHELFKERQDKFD